MKVQAKFNFKHDGIYHAGGEVFEAKSIKEFGHCVEVLEEQKHEEVVAEEVAISEPEEAVVEDKAEQPKKKHKK